MTVLSKRQVAHMLDRLTKPGVSIHATLADGAALVATSEAFAAAFCDREVQLEDVALRAQQLVEAEDGNDPALLVVAAAAGRLVVEAAAAARRVWP